MTTDQVRLRVAIRGDLLRTLERAASQRNQREDLVDGQPGWVGHERRAMHEAVNRWRHRLALPPVPLVEIERVERAAEGHIDYAWKSALRCADLAAGEG
jgi:hypothetical protein